MDTLINKAWLQFNDDDNKKETEYSNTVTAEIKRNMFTILKSQGKSELSGTGDIQDYTIACTNISGNIRTNVTFADSVPVGSSYVAGSFKVNGIVTVPVISGAYITHVIPSWAVGVVHTFQFQVSVN